MLMQFRVMLAAERDEPAVIYLYPHGAREAFPDVMGVLASIVDAADQARLGLDDLAIGFRFPWAFLYARAAIRLWDHKLPTSLLPLRQRARW